MTNLRFRSLLPTLGLLLLSGAFAVTAGAAQETGWVMLQDSHGEPSRRSENGYASANGKFYLMGGGSQPVDIYDPATDTWTSGAAPPLPINHFQAVTWEGKIYVLGAFTGGFPVETPVPHIYIYHPDRDEWERGPEIPADRRRGSTGAVAYGDRIYLIGGLTNGHTDGHVRWFDAFDPRTGEWERLPDIPRHRDHFQAAVKVAADIVFVRRIRRPADRAQKAPDLCAVCLDGARTVEPKLELALKQVDDSRFGVGKGWDRGRKDPLRHDMSGEEEGQPS